MKTLDMVKLFHEYLDMSNDQFKNIKRPISDTVIRYLNDGYLKMLGTLCNAGNFPVSVKQTGANLESMRRLVIEKDIVPNSTLIPGKLTLDLPVAPDEYAYYVRGTATMTRTAVPAVSDELVEMRPVHDMEIQSMQTTIYNKPIIRVPVVSFIDNQMIIYHDVYSTISSINLQYIKKPDPLTMDTVSECVLEPDNLCHDITRMALDQFIRSVAMFAQEPQQQTQQ